MSAARWALAAAAAGPLLAQSIAFEDIAAKSGLQFTLRNGATGRFHLPELMPGGVAALDFDRDGCLDIYFTNGAEMPSLKKTGPGFYNRLFRNDCRGRFEDVTAKAGVAGEGYSIAAATGDYDGNGYVDLFVAGVDRNLLYRNRGDGTFEETALRAGLSGGSPKPWSISAAFFDMDSDGRPDLFVSNYVAWNPAAEPACGPAAERFYCHPATYRGRRHQLFRNNGDGTFGDVSAASGIATYLGKGMGVAVADFDRDGRSDLYVANDSMRNFLFRNLGGGKFSETGLELGASLGESGRAIASMGVDWADYDNDGRPDLAVTGMANDCYLLFGNAGPPLFFEDRTAASGLARATRSLTGWGMGFADFDNDGLRDLFFANAHFPQLGRLMGKADPLSNMVMRNVGNGQFADATARAGLGAAAFHRGAAFGDFDRDGRVDVVVSAIGSSAKLYRNITAGAGKSIALGGALGTQYEVELPDGRKLFGHVTSSVGYASASEPVARFGLGRAAAPKAVRVREPGGPWRPKVD